MSLGQQSFKWRQVCACSASRWVSCEIVASAVSLLILLRSATNTFCSFPMHSVPGGTMLLRGAVMPSRDGDGPTTTTIKNSIQNHFLAAAACLRHHHHHRFLCRRKTNMPHLSYSILWSFRYTVRRLLASITTIEGTSSLPQQVTRLGLISQIISRSLALSTLCRHSSLFNSVVRFG